VKRDTLAVSAEFRSQSETFRALVHRETTLLAALKEAHGLECVRLGTELDALRDEISTSGRAIGGMVAIRLFGAHWREP
jgi:hypothetical protein